MFDDSFLEPVGKRAIVVRMLANLENVAGMRGDLTLLQRVFALQATLPGTSAWLSLMVSLLNNGSPRVGESVRANVVLPAPGSPLTSTTTAVMLNHTATCASPPRIPSGTIECPGLESCWRARAVSR